VRDRYASAIYLRPASFDTDDYFIFNSNGTYRFSYGKNGNSSTLQVEVPAYEPYRKYLPNESHGYWKILDNAPNFQEGKRSSWGLELTDAVTLETFAFDYIRVLDDSYTFNRWYPADNHIRVIYSFKASEADADYTQWLVN
jgi:hypothetical protein